MYDAIFIESASHNVELVKKIKNYFISNGYICFSNFIRKIKQTDDIYYEKNVKILNQMIEKMNTIMFYFHNDDDVLKDFYNELYKDRKIKFKQITCINIGEKINSDSAYQILIKHIEERVK